MTISHKEMNRADIVQAICDKRLKRRDGALQLNLTERQVQRLVNRYREHGISGLIHGQRGKKSNHSFSEPVKLKVLTLLRENYSDLGPTLATKKLKEKHDIAISVETIRKWMISDGLWIPYIQRKPLE
ncbi:helix-turn-helix domain-containing protein [Providencia sp. Je.9.19]|uniref:helix-turn-helix domain-containing protein n=1 Tax=Providencia sp. Je.9.19 TaxID=3142844 RepID=UPI003DA92C89